VQPRIVEAPAQPLIIEALVQPRLIVEAPAQPPLIVEAKVPLVLPRVRAFETPAPAQPLVGVRRFQTWQHAKRHCEEKAQLRMPIVHADIIQKVAPWFLDTSGHVHSDSHCPWGEELAVSNWDQDSELPPGLEFCEACKGGACSICLCPLEVRTQIRSLNCPHWIHEECFWQMCFGNMHLKCPECRIQFFFC
jgi:hypothetical protein